MTISNLGAERMQAILEAQTRVAAAQLDPAGVMALAASEAQSLTQAGGAVVALIEGDELVCRAASGSERRSVGTRSSSQEGLEGRVVSGKSAARSGTAACAPLLRDGEVWGAVKVVSSDGKPFGDDDVAALE